MRSELCNLCKMYDTSINLQKRMHMAPLGERETFRKCIKVIDDTLFERFEKIKLGELEITCANPDENHSCSMKSTIEALKPKNK
jgi:hypothetical protein